jgi:hypothetical protein
MKALKVISWIVLVLVFIAISTLTTVDRSPIYEQDFYKQTFERLDDLDLKSSQGDTWLAGWAKANMTPDQPVDLVGYKPRGPYEFVLDSSYVKAITLSNGKSRIAWLNYELLIIHPFLAKEIKNAMAEAKLPIDQVIFTATHTHEGMGGYMPGPIGEMAFGGFNQGIVDLMVQRSISALNTAISSQDTVSINYRKADAGAFVANRFIPEDPTDPFVRQLIFTKKKSGKKATFLTFSAHATSMNSNFMGLSGDYPFYLTQEMESKGYELALFAAGAVGSHRPVTKGNSPESVKDYAHELDSTINLGMTSYSTVNNPQITSALLPISLRSPTLRIADNIRIRPWVFNYLMGDTNAHLDITQIGNTLMIASSGEVSGVFYERWEKIAQNEGLNLIVTTFNGGYIGYITPDKYYDRHFHEVREMNWYGPGNGQYFDQLFEAIIKKSHP